MTTSELNKERLQTIASWRAKYSAGHNVVLPAEEAEMMARSLLAAMEQEPFGYYSAEVPTIMEQQSHANITREAMGEYQFPLYASSQTMPELTSIVERLNLSGYEHENEGVTPKNAATVVDTLLKQLDDAVQKPAAAVPDEINVLQAANLVLRLGVLDNGIPTVAMKVWNACRAAMLQGSQPVSNRDELPVVPENCVTAEHRRVIEMLLKVCGAAFELADDSCQQEVDGEECLVIPYGTFGKLSDALDEIENTLPTEDVDRPDVFLCWSAMPRAALKSILQPGNSPVIPDGWIKCSERMPEDGDAVLVCQEGGIIFCAEVDSGWFYPDEFPNVPKEGREITHWMSLPVAPQQEKTSG